MLSTTQQKRTRSIVIIAVAALAVLIVAVVIFGALFNKGGGSAQPDDFYTAPADVPSEHGQLIRAENIVTGVPEGAEGWRILYTTTNVDGSPAVASGVVLAPATRDGSALPVITIGHGTTGVAQQCAPSLSATPFYDGAALTTIELVINQGMVAVTSDYAGMGTAGQAAYLVGEVAGHNVLDAALSVKQLEGLTVADKTLIWGYSQGGQAALWAGQAAASYAPALEVLGVAAFAPAADAHGVLDANRTNGSGQTLAAYVIATWNAVFPELELAAQFAPEAFTSLEQAASHCIADNAGISKALGNAAVPNPILSDALLAGDFGTTLAAQTPTGPWPAPVFVAQGADDQLVFATIQDAWVEEQCAAGNAIDYRTYAGRDHLTLTANDSPMSVQLGQWALERLAGAPAPSECTSQAF